MYLITCATDTDTRFSASSSIMEVVSCCFQLLCQLLLPTVVENCFWQLKAGPDEQAAPFAFILFARRLQTFLENAEFSLVLPTGAAYAVNRMHSLVFRVASPEASSCRRLLYSFTLRS
jgi:hypothetical protein